MNSLAAAVTLLLLAVCISGRELVQIAFVHRHGARQVGQFYDAGNNTIDMTWEHSDLTPAGAQMAVNLGTFMRTNYASFIPAVWDQFSYVAQSTDISRTIQTGVGVMRGLFGNSSTNVPFLSHEPQAVDYMMYFSSNIPNHIVREDSVYMPWKHNDDLAKTILTDLDVQVMVEAFGDWCNDEIMECALYAEDFAQCQISNGVLSAPLTGIFPRLQQLQMLQNKVWFAFNSSSEYAVAGSIGYPLANKWMTDGYAAIAAYTANGGALTSAAPRVFHYSAHDNTIAGLLATLGNVSFETENVDMWVPRFAQVVIAEFYSDSTVTFKWSKPQMESTTTHEYLPMMDLYVSCMSNASNYSSSSCPLDDVWRFINTTAPLVPNAPCYLSPRDQSICTQLGNDAVSAACQTYRTLCPAEACLFHEDSVLDEADNAELCLPFVYPPAFRDNAAPSIISSVVGFFVGIMLGLGIEFLLSFAQQGKDYLEDSTSHSSMDGSHVNYYDSDDAKR